MTENGAIRKLKCEQERNRTPSVDIAYCMAIQALEEIQQYRAIGTVEECRIAVERMKRYINSDCVVFRNDKKSPYEFPL